ncbi:MAG: GAP family protein [Nanoarchaeota archaeon]
MVAEILLPTWPLVVSTALIDSINPCAIGVLVIMIATLLKFSKDKKKMIIIGLIYITSVFLTYLAAGFGLLTFIQKFPGISIYLGWIVGVIVIIMGIIEIKDFFWYGQGFSLHIPKKHAKTIMEKLDNLTIGSSIFLGIFVAAVELPCTGGPYLAITTALAKIGLSWKVFWLLVIYNIIFVMPLLVILFLVYFGMDADKISKWKDDKKKWMRLFAGLLLITLGIILILFANGTISLII